MPKEKPYFHFVAPSPHWGRTVFTHFDPEDWQAICDLFQARRDEYGGWLEARVLHSLNSEGPDFGAFISMDGKALYYRKNYEFIQVPLITIDSTSPTK